MKNTNVILHDKAYRDMVLELEALERDRKFCKHDLDHFINVARIAYILNLEEACGFSKDLIYTTALLHDIGRVMEYKDGTPHDIGSYNIAKDMLLKTDFNEDEQSLILDAILNHRHLDESHSFNRIIFRADKLSRDCYRCKMFGECHWDDNLKNVNLKY